MNKKEFLDALSDKLSVFSEEDRKKSVDYYSEIIDDGIEDGLTEEEAVAKIGDVTDVAAGIIADAPIKTIVKQKVKRSKTLTVLAIIGSPLWIALGAAAAAVIIAFLACVFAVWAAYIAIGIACAAGFVVGIANAVYLFINWNLPLMTFFAGCALVCLGIAIIIFMFIKPVTKGVFKLFGQLKLIKRLFIGKEKKDEA